MTPIAQLNNLERKLHNFGIRIVPRQTAQGAVTLPVRYVEGGCYAELTCIGGRIKEQWYGSWSPIVKARIKEHFSSFLTVDAL